jgi:hypothetical protein
MAFDLALYERHVARVDLEDLDLEAGFRAEPLSRSVLRCVRYMHDVEHHTSCYVRNLLNTKAHHDPEISAFLTLWAFEEHWHGHALARVLAAHEEPAGDLRVRAMRRRLGWRLTASPLLWMMFSASTRDFLAVHMTFGAVNEWTTQAAYGRLGAVAGHETLRELLRRIMKQEGRHIDFYRSRAVEELDGSPSAQRTTKLLLRTAWDPVGSKVMPKAETVHLVRTLFSDAEGRAVAARVDRRVDALPGLADLRLVDRALAQLRS